MGRQCYWVGKGISPRWQDAGNWASEPGGRPGYPKPQFGDEVIIDSNSGDGAIDLGGCPAKLTIQGHRGTVHLPNGGAINFAGGGGDDAE